MTAIIAGIFILFMFLIPILAVLIILGIHRFVSYNRAKRLFSTYQTRSFKKKRKYVKI